MASVKVKGLLKLINIWLSYDKIKVMCGCFIWLLCMVNNEQQLLQAEELTKASNETVKSDSDNYPDVFHVQSRA